VPNPIGIAASSGATKPFASMPAASTAYIATSHSVRRAGTPVSATCQQKIAAVTERMTRQSGRSVRASSTKPSVVASITPATSPARAP
jgi:hypothetical protein